MKGRSVFDGSRRLLSLTKETLFAKLSFPEDGFGSISTKVPSYKHKKSYIEYRDNRCDGGPACDGLGLGT